MATANAISRPVQHHVPVDPSAAEQLLTAAHLGKRIKGLRLKRSMGLMELGKLTGLSASFLSQLETGRVVPTLRNLARLSLVFKKDISFFFEDEGEKIFRVQRKKDRVRLALGPTQPDYIAESLSILIPEGGLRPCLAELLPGEQREALRAEQTPGVEMVYVLSGALEVCHSGQRHILRDRDLLYVSSESPRTYRCHGSTSAQALIVSFDEEAVSRRSKRH